MENQFSQKDLLLNSRYFELRTEGIHIQEKSVVRSNEYFVPFEMIGTKRLVIKSIKKGWLLGTIALFILSAGLFVFEKTGGDTDHNAFVVYLIFGLITGVIALGSRKRYLYLTQFDSKNAIEFLLNRPNETLLNNFIEQVITARNSFLTDKYLRFNKAAGIDKNMETLEWLCKTDAITKEVYDQKLEELHIFFNQQEVRGFRIGGHS